MSEKRKNSFISKSNRYDSVENHVKNSLTEINDNNKLTISKYLTKRENKSPIGIYNDKVLLTSIFYLPIIHKNKRYSRQPKTERMTVPSQFINTLSLSSKKENLNEKIMNPNQTIDNYCQTETEENEKKKKTKPLSKLETQMKEKFYIDVENKINVHLKNKKFIEDEMLHNRIVHMKKVSTFWNGVADYINPIFQVEKFRINKLLRGEKIKKEEKEKFTKKLKPKLYTTMVMNNMKYNLKKEKEKLFYEKLKEMQKDYEFYKN